MPPKKQEPSKKTELKKKEKIVEDKTFGLKNKKGAKQQRFIQTVQTQVTNMGKSAKQLTQSEKERLEREKKKEEKKKLQEELSALFKPVEQKIGKGTDPKSVLCAFFKAGQCTKGDKCKFSHDLAIERKAEKRSLYEDKKEEETMEGWDEEKLAEVIDSKHGESNKTKQKTDIICKFFLEAVETNKYGWFWNCPKGEACIYKHILPPGFVMKKDSKKEAEGEKISLEDLIEKERATLSSQDLTRVTLESFLKWKERKRQDRLSELKAASEKKKSNFAVGKLFGISGKELFEFNPDMVIQDDDEADADVYEREEDEEGEERDDQTREEVREIDLSMFSSEHLRSHPTPLAPSNHPPPSSSSSSSHTSHNHNPPPPNKKDKNTALQNGNVDDGGGAASSSRGGGDDDDLLGAVGGEGAIDENLFDGEDLDMVEDELEHLELEG